LLLAHHSAAFVKLSRLTGQLPNQVLGWMQGRTDPHNADEYLRFSWKHTVDAMGTLPETTHVLDCMVRGYYCIAILGNVISVNGEKQMTSLDSFQKNFVKRGWGYTFRLSPKKFFADLKALRATDSTKSGKDVAPGEGVLSLRSDLLKRSVQKNNFLFGPGYKYQSNFSIV
jgi:hypothetical protein